MILHIQDERFCCRASCLSGLTNLNPFLFILSDPGNQTDLCRGTNLAPTLVRPVKELRSIEHSSYSGRVAQELITRSSLSRGLHNWVHELKDDLSRSFITQDLSEGFSIIPDIDRVASVDCSNYASSLNETARPILDNLFRQEIAEGKLSMQEKMPIRSQAIRAVDKRGEGSFRPITDCSRPEDDFLNGYIETEQFFLESLDDALTLSTQDCFYGVVD